MESPIERRWAFKKGPALDTPIMTRFEVDDDDAFGRIRCPLCLWQPTRSSVWLCGGSDPPHSSFRGCGTTWNTFTTRGRCPGCAHQWRWTSCLRCAGWSLHEDWYEEEGTSS